MAADDEAVVRRFYEQMCNERKNDLAGDLFTADHEMHDPQLTTGRGPQGMVDAISTYQDGVEGHWELNDIFSTGNRVVVRWTGTGTHSGTVNGIPPTGKKVDVSAITIHHMRDGKIAETYEVWDTLGFLQQIGVVPSQ